MLDEKETEKFIQELCEKTRVSPNILKKNLLGREGVMLIQRQDISFETMLAVTESWVRAGKPNLFKKIGKIQC